MFDDLLRLAHAHWQASPNIGRPLWQPAADIYRTRHGWLIKMELAGVRQDEIQISIRDRNLVVHGIRRDSQQVECDQCYSLEIAYSRFERQIQLPCDLEHARIATDYRDGMLLIQVDVPQPENAPPDAGGGGPTPSA